MLRDKIKMISIREKNRREVPAIGFDKATFGDAVRSPPATGPAGDVVSFRSLFFRTGS